jgi:tetraacyldisaccharide 4'-kinase
MIKLIYPKFWQSKNIIAYLLLPFSQIYLLISYLRKLLATPIIFPAKVICVGNINVGGTGKTQLVIHLARLLREQNIKFLIITKAYGSKLTKATIVERYHSALDVGDESLILAKYGYVIAAKKIQQALNLVHKLKPAIIIVDDSLQNPNFYKDLILLAIDAHRGFGNGFLIPAGPLRESPVGALKRADLIFFVQAVKFRFPDYLEPYSDKLLQAQIVIANPIDKTKNYFAFSGIGNPERFLITLENHGLNIIGNRVFPDHYNYLQKDLKDLLNKAEKNNAVLITTRKDYVKLYNLLGPLNDSQIVCTDIDLVINDKLNLIHEKIFKKR